MISIQDRIRIIKLINGAMTAGARIKPCCNVVDISIRTYERWNNGGVVNEDQRPFANKPSPLYKLSKEEYESVVRIANLPEYADLAPS